MHEKCALPTEHRHDISTTTATVAALGRFDRKGYKGEGVGRDQGFVGSGLLNEPTSSGDAHVGAKVRAAIVSRGSVLA